MLPNEELLTGWKYDFDRQYESLSLSNSFVIDDDSENVEMISSFINDTEESDKRYNNEEITTNKIRHLDIDNPELTQTMFNSLRD